MSLARSQDVEADPADHRGQPASKVVDGRAVLAGEPQPGLLDHVLGIGMRSEHAVGDRAQPISLGLERLGHTVRRAGVGHVVTFLGPVPS
jgi:hypothetical protein